MSQDQEMDMDNENSVITLVDEEANEHDFILLDMVEIEGQEYALLQPASEEEVEDVVVMRVEEDQFKVIEDEAEWERVAAFLETQYAEEGEEEA